MDSLSTSFIYALEESDTCLVRYVGKTKDPYRRMIRHRNLYDYDHNLHRANWIKKVFDRGADVEMVILEEVSLPDVERVEMAWIQMLCEAGCDLTNVQYTPEVMPV